MSNTIANPYVGPRTYTSAERHLFFGRDREARDLLARVLSERLVLFYAQSGAGKSSLLNARLIPQLRSSNFAVLPVARVGGDLPAGIDPVGNIFLFNLMLRIDESETDAQRFAHLTLSEFLARLSSDDGERFYYDAMQPFSASSDAGEDATGVPYVLIVDQFEEIITSHPGRWEERTEFFRQLNQAMLDDSNLWVLLTLREDYIAPLEPYAPLLADRMRARFYMQRMGDVAALEAVQRPAETAGRPFARDVAEELVDNLRLVYSEWGAQEGMLVPGEFVEPVQLQVVCYQLWEKLREIPGDQITREHLDKLTGDQKLAGFVNRALGDYYQQALDAVVNQQLPCASERSLRRWFSEVLITADETRNLVRMGEESTGTAQVTVPNSAVKLLADQFLLRTEMRSANKWVELVHDRFIQPILQANREWTQANQSPVAQAAKAWVDAGRVPAKLYSDNLLRDTRQQLAARPADFSDLDREFVAASVEAEKQRKARRRLIAFIATAFIVGLLSNIAFLVGQRAVDAINETIETAAVAAKATVQVALAESDAAVAEAEAEAARAQAQAVAARAEAEAARAQAQAAANTLTNVAITLAQTDPQLGLLLAAEAANQAQAGSQSGTLAETTLRSLLNATGGVTLRSHEGSVNAITFDPAGDQLAAAGSDGVLRLWQVEALETVLAAVRTGQSSLNDVAYRADGRQIATAGSDGTVGLWMLDAGDVPSTTLRAGRTSVNAVEYSPDGQLLGSGGADSTVRIWQANEPQTAPVVLRTNQASINDVAFSPNGQQLAAAGADGTVHLWQTSALQSQATVLRGHEGSVNAAIFGPEGRLLATAGADGSIRIWTSASPDLPPVVLSGHQGSVNSLAFSPNGQLLASGGADGFVRFWQVGAPEATPAIWRSYQGSVNGVTFSPDGALFASGGADGTVHVWQINSPQVDPTIVRTGQGDANDVAYSPAGDTLASAGADGTVLLLLADTPLFAADILTITGAAANAVAYSPDQRWLAAAGSDGLARLWNISAPEAEPVLLRGGAGSMNDVAFSFDSRLVATADAAAVRVWQTAALAARPVSLDAQGGGANALAFSPDGRWLATAGGDGNVRLWTVASFSAAPAILPGHSGSVLDVAFSPDSLVLASAGSDGAIHLWNVNERRAGPTVLAGHEGSANAVTFSPGEGRQLASAGADGSVRLWYWNATDSGPVVLRGHQGAVNAVAYRPNGSQLASAASDGTLRIWTIPLGDLVALACQTSGRNFTEAEWEQYFPGEPYRNTCPDLP